MGGYAGAKAGAAIGASIGVAGGPIGIAVGGLSEVLREGCGLLARKNRGELVQ